MARTWNKRHYGTRWGHAFFHWMLRLGGLPAAYFCLYFVVFIYVFFFPSVKRNCRPYLIRRFPQVGRAGQMFHSYKLVLSFGKILIDSAAFRILGPSCIQADFQGLEDYKRINALDSGCIILMSHIGCWQVAIPALSQLSRPVNLLMLQAGGPKAQSDETGQFKIINPDQFLGGTLDMLNVLKNDEILCIMGDRLFGNSAYSLEMDFLKEKAYFPFSAYKLASIAQKPILVLNTHKTGTHAYKISLPEIIHIPRKLGKTGQNYAPYARAYVDALEKYTDDHPYQFFNFYDMWNSHEGEGR